MAEMQVMAFWKACNFYLLPFKNMDYGLIVNQYMLFMIS